MNKALLSGALPHIVVSIREGGRWASLVFELARLTRTELEEMEVRL